MSAPDARGERALASAVILRAILDAVGEKDTTAEINEAAQFSAMRQHAREFLVAGSGHWAESRQAWADAAGLDPDWVAQRAALILRSGQVARGRRSYGRVKGVYQQPMEWG